jgi:hypothetical protein
MTCNCVLVSLPRTDPDEHARTVRSSSQSIKSSPKVRVLGLPQYAPIASARSKSGSIRTWSSSARGAAPRASRRLRSRRSSSSGLNKIGLGGMLGNDPGPRSR